MKDGQRQSLHHYSAFTLHSLCKLLAKLMVSSTVSVYEPGITHEIKVCDHIGANFPTMHFCNPRSVVMLSLAGNEIFIQIKQSCTNRMVPSGDVQCTLRSTVTCVDCMWRGESGDDLYGKVMRTAPIGVVG
jgi:hypothetical protein